jgi:hypothetical protein
MMNASQMSSGELPAPEQGMQRLMNIHPWLSFGLNLIQSRIKIRFSVSYRQVSRASVVLVS